MRDPGEGVTGDGFIRTGVRRDRVPAAFEPVLAEAIREVAAYDGAAPVYLYGSVATGQAVFGRSDVDLLVIGLPDQVARDIAARLSQTHRGLCRVVALSTAVDADLAGDSDEAYGNRVFLKHYCVHLAGADPAAGLPPARADERAARGFNGDLNRSLVRWRERAGAADPAALAGPVARKTLLAVAGLVSVHDGTWTTDRAAAARWAEVRPRLAVDLGLLLHWVADPGAACSDRVERMLADGGAVSAVVADFRDLIGLWPDD